jgi:hypothetical protein
VSSESVTQSLQPAVRVKSRYIVFVFELEVFAAIPAPVLQEPACGRASTVGSQRSTTRTSDDVGINYFRVMTDSLRM